MTGIAARALQCMEVWGGNRAADQGVVMPGLDAWIYSEPFADQPARVDSARAAPLRGSDSAGGDVHFLSSCGTGRITRIVLADVSGHGAHVADVASSLKTLMRRFMNYLDQTSFIEALNRAFDETGAGAGRFATSVAMTFFAPSAQLDLCNAGHPRPLLYRASKRDWTFLIAPKDGEEAGDDDIGGDITNLPLGILAPTRYEQFGLRLARGDLVLAYTDAVTEARSPTGELLGEEGFRGLLSKLDASRPETLLPAITEALSAWRGGAATDDDLTLLLLRHNGVGTQAPLFRRLGASVRFLGSVARNLVPVGERPPVPWPEWRAENLLGALVPHVGRRWRGARAR